MSGIVLTTLLLEHILRYLERPPLMENGQKVVSELFDGRKIFNVPKYQRAYAWETKQLRDFLSDLDSQAAGKEYFLGTILLQLRELEGHFRLIDVVDGQQRLTTIVVFMAVLLNILEDRGDDVGILRETYIVNRNEYKLRVLEYDQEFFRTYILGDITPDESENSVIQTPSQKRLIRAKRFFQSELEKRSLDELRVLRYKIENAKLLTYSVVNNSQATLIFETTNDRGKPLTSLEKIKSFLMYKIYQAADEPEDHLAVIQSNFGEMYRDFEEILRHWTTDEDFILRNHYVTFCVSAEPGKVVDLGNHVGLVKNRVNILTKTPQTYSEATD